MADRSGNRTQSAPQRTGPGRPGMRRGGPMGMGMGAFERAKNPKGTLRRLWHYLSAQRAALILVVALVGIGSALAVAGPYLMGRAIDEFILVKDLPGLGRMALLMLGAYTTAALANYAQSFVMAGVSQRTVRHLRRDLFDKLQTLPLRYFDTRPHGETMSRLTNDVDTISIVLSMGVTQFISSAVSLLMVASTMLVLNWRLGLVALITLPAMAGLTRFITRYTRRGFQEQQATLGALNGVIEESITGLHVIKSMAREEAAIGQFGVANQAYRQAATFAQTYAGLLGPMSNVIHNASIAIVAAAGGWLTLAGYATVGTIASFISYARQFGRPLNMMANLYNMLLSALAGAERVFEVMDEEPEPEDVPGARALDQIRGEVVFDDVCFSYQEGVPVLKHVSFHAHPGQTIALVGPTGAGKTTVVNLLTRFYDIDSGSICIDGVDLRELQRDSLRRQLGIVLQDTVLFAETVMENIRYGRLDATDEEVIEAAVLANADHFIRRLPHGYATKLSEQGGNLSQGQRQLLAIARVMLADPGILVLDEATSSIDTRTEQHIQEALLKLMEGRTAFVIAHRLSTIRNADQVLVINDGQIIERGTHHELLDLGGFYHRLYMSQFKVATPEIA
jgi:ATP-binding cassette, subfamily B, multidrug efflux pump